MLTTTKLGLKKPQDTDNADLSIFIGENMDKLDVAIGNNTTLPTTSKEIVGAIAELSTALGTKVNNSQVLTNVPVGAIFTDNNTVTSINGKTGVIVKADIVALGIPAQDTVYVHPVGTNPHGTTKTDIGLANVANVDTTTTANITDSTNKRMLTDAQEAKVDATSGTNTGDETLATIKAKLSITTLSGSNTGDQVIPVTSVSSRTGAIVLTSTDVGLANVNNTSDINKPISTAQQSALDLKANSSQVLTNVPSSAIFTDTVTTVNGKTGAIAKADIVALGIPAQDTVYTLPSTLPSTMITGLGTVANKNTGTTVGTIPILDSNGKIDVLVLPALAITDTFVVASQVAMLALTAEVGDIAVRTDLNKSFILRVAGATVLANWQELLTPTDSVTSVAGKSGVVTLTKSDVGLANVVNLDTSTTANITDSLNKRMLTDVQEAKLDAITGTNTGDETLATIKTKLAITTLSGSNTGDQIIPTSLPANGGNSDTVDNLHGSDLMPIMGKGSGSLQAGREYYNVTSFEISATPIEIVIKTKIPYLDGNSMPIIHLHGYAYGQNAPIELKVAFYIYAGNFVSMGAVSLGSWKPTIKLFTWLDGATERVALALVGSIYYPRFSVNFLDIWQNSTRDYSQGWTVESTPDVTIVGTTDLVTVPYKATFSQTINGVVFDGTSNITIADATKEPTISKLTGFNLPLDLVATNIKMDGVQSLGVLNTLPRADHIHPTDTSRASTTPVTVSVNGIMLATDKVKMDAILGTNTGDETLATIKTKLGITTLSGSNTGDQVIPIQTVAGRTGTIVLTSADVGLGSVNNTSDINKPVSTAQQTALDLKTPFSTLTATTPATTQWYRIATSVLNIGANSGLFKVDFSGVGIKGSTLFRASCHDGVVIGSGVNQIGFTTTNVLLGLTQIRVVYHTTFTANYAYVEIFNPTALAISYVVDLIDTTGWSLLTPSTVGSIPAGYVAETLILDTGIVSGEDVTATRQLISKVAIGTPPITVTSNTLVPLLNVSLLNGLASTAFATSAQGTLATNATPNTHMGSGGTAHADVTTTVDGFMIATDKVKLDSIASGANVNTVTSVSSRTGAIVLTKTDVGLANVDNTTDLLKPVSTAQQTALDLKVDDTQVLTNVPVGAIFTDTVYVHPVGTNPHGTTKTDLALGNVDNTSDINKPVSTAQALAITNLTNAIGGQLNSMRFFFTTTNGATPPVGTVTNNDVWFDVYTATIKLRLANTSPWIPFGYTYQ